MKTIFRKKNKYCYELTEEAKAMNFKVETTVSAETIENIIVVSLECAADYWVGLDNTTEAWEEQPEDLPASQYAAQLIITGKQLTLYDIENPEEQWILDISKLTKGIGEALRLGYDIGGDCSDEILQFALFGKLVYGYNAR